MRTLLVLALFALPAHAQPVYRCAGPGGQPVFQQAPCSGGQVVNSKPANVVEGNPAGERDTRSQAQRNFSASRLIEAGQVVGGMTESEVYRAWGNPATVNTDVVRGKVFKQMVFRGPDGARYAYTEDGVVTSTQYRPGDRTEARATGTCYSEQDIRSARVSASSITHSTDRQKELRTQVDAMKLCQ